MTQRAYFIYLGNQQSVVNSQDFQGFWNKVQKTEIPGLPNAYLFWTDMDLTRLQSYGIRDLLVLPIDYGQLQTLSGVLPGYLGDFNRHRVQAA
jgi:hypothetical protein